MWVQSGYANTVTIPATTHTIDGNWWKYTLANSLLYCDRLNYAGHTDWRLPNVKELMSIVDYSKLNPSINTTFFTNTKASGYRCGTLYVTPGVGAYIVSFDYGPIFSGSYVSASYVRPVRLG
jgi:hypothetical protein